jgi:hypothetical protein
MAMVSKELSMRRGYVVLSLALIVILDVSCKGSRISLENWSQIVDRARAQAILKSPTLDSLSHAMIRTNEPKLFVAHLPFGGGEYHLVWQISSNRTAELKGHGDFKMLDELENAALVVRKVAPGR